MARAQVGGMVGPRGRSPSARKKLQRFIRKAEKGGELGAWRRGRAVLGYILGRSVIELTVELNVARSSVNRWIQWYETLGVAGLITGKSPGRPPRLASDQHHQLTLLVENGPAAAGYTSGMWTGPMIRDLIEDRFGVKYHNHHIPRLLHQLGFSVQRPRKRLARADAEKQARWLRVTFPAIKKKPLLVADS